MGIERTASGNVIDIGSLETNSAQVKTNGLEKTEMLQVPHLVVPTGPVAAIIPVQNKGEAIRVANDSVFGLGAAVFTQDLIKAENIVKQLESGSCFVNTHVRSDPRLPFGGIKESGYGRELSHYGLKEFTNIRRFLSNTDWIGGGSDDTS